MSRPTAPLPPPIAAGTLAAAALLAASPAARGAPPRAPADTLRPKACAERLPDDARCYDLPVPEDRSARGGRTVALNVAVLPGPDSVRGRRALFFLAGGPGQAATESGVPDWMRELRDVVLVDQRGTGGSNGLYCDLYGGGGPEALLGDWFPPEALRRCRERLRRRADLTRYTTPRAADDLDAVRRGLGYGRIDLWGGSYGSRLALVYLRRHPGAVRSVVLHGATGPDLYMPLTYPEDAQRALEGVLADCAAEAACSEAFPDPRESYRRALARFEGGPVPAGPSGGGDTARAELSRGTWAQSLRYLLYGGNTAALVPLYLDAAAGGDFDPFAEFILRYRRRLADGLAQGMFLSVTCAEDVPWIDPAEARRRAEGTFLGTWRYRQQRAACREWPRAGLPEGYREPVASDAPVLVVTGELDPVLPPGRSQEAIDRLPNARVVAVPEAGHSWGGLRGRDCIDRLQADFLRRGSADGLDTGCLEEVRRVPFVTEPPEEEAVELAPEQLRRFEGRYAGPELAVTVRLEDGRLVVEGSGVPRLVLVPVGERRFRIEDGPPGTYVEFTGGEAGRIDGLRVLEGGAETLVLGREPPGS